MSYEEEDTTGSRDSNRSSSIENTFYKEHIL